MVLFRVPRQIQNRSAGGAGSRHFRLFHHPASPGTLGSSPGAGGTPSGARPTSPRSGASRPASGACAEGTSASAALAACSKSCPFSACALPSVSAARSTRYDTSGGGTAAVASSARSQSSTPITGALVVSAFLATRRAEAASCVRALCGDSSPGQPLALQVPSPGQAPSAPAPVSPRWRPTSDRRRCALPSAGQENPP